MASPVATDRRSLEIFLARLNEIRRVHPALCQLRTLRFHGVDNDALMAMSKFDPVTGDTVLVVVTLNPWRTPADRHVLRRFDYAHPVFDAAAVAAQSRLSAIQGRGRVWYAGAWTGYGFHEDGVRSAVDVATSLGVSVPWRADARRPERA